MRLIARECACVGSKEASRCHIVVFFLSAMKNVRATTTDSSFTAPVQMDPTLYPERDQGAHTRTTCCVVAVRNSCVVRSSSKGEMKLAF